MKISLIEQIVSTYPKGMEKFRMYRIEYGGHGPNCLCEGTIWLPVGISPTFAESYLRGLINSGKD